MHAGGVSPQRSNEKMRFQSFLVLRRSKRLVASSHKASVSVPIFLSHGPLRGPYDLLALLLPQRTRPPVDNGTVCLDLLNHSADYLDPLDESCHEKR